MQQVTSSQTSLLFISISILVNKQNIVPLDWYFLVCIHSCVCVCYVYCVFANRFYVLF